MALEPLEERIALTVSASFIPATGVLSVFGDVADNNIVVTYPIAEMGQGTMTGLAQCVAEEARADWSKVTTVAADWQNSGFTGGSDENTAGTPNSSSSAKRYSV